MAWIRSTEDKAAIACAKSAPDVAAGVAALIGVGFLYSGFYPMGADDRHNDLTYWALETLCERSIARASTGIEAPAELNSSERLLAGGADYNDMCAGCLLKPGKTESDFTLGLYPAPPKLTRTTNLQDDAEAQARRRFWIIMTRHQGVGHAGLGAWS